MVGYKVGYQLKTTLILPLANATYHLYCNWHNPSYKRSEEQCGARNGLLSLSQNCNILSKQERDRRNLFPKGFLRLLLCKVKLSRRPGPGSNRGCNHVPVPAVAMALTLAASEFTQSHNKPVPRFCTSAVSTRDKTFMKTEHSG